MKFCFLSVLTFCLIGTTGCATQPYTPPVQLPYDEMHPGQPQNPLFNPDINPCIKDPGYPGCHR